MDPCLRNDTLIGNYTFSMFEPAYNRNQPCGPSTYMRPNIGGALYPWIYLLPIFIIHIPVLWERVYHWEKVQVIALALAVYTIATTAMSYLSSHHFDPKQILVWMPLTLTLDFGAMLQLVILIQAKDKEHGSIWKRALPSLQFWVHQQSIEGEQPGIALHQLQQSQQQQDSQQRNEDDHRQEEAERNKRAWIAVAALVALVVLFALQMIGLIFASIGLKFEDFKVLYCSPLLENLVVGVYDRGMNNVTTNCPVFHAITVDSNKGIGCFGLDGKRQRDWLFVTVIVLSLSLFVQTLDTIILLFAPERSGRLQSMDLRRPWGSVSYFFL
jgi:hypothetical protein